MFYTVNLESRVILTYRDGSPIINASQEVARSYAAHAQELTGDPHADVPIGNLSSHLKRDVAPWLKRS